MNFDKCPICHQPWKACAHSYQQMVDRKQEQKVEKLVEKAVIKTLKQYNLIPT